eukprot:NODE_498_length_7675_cov_0.481389.p5 type:complete len:202 gc:universal NODE_498_length_7675_cov_0.481389:7432-6827(-)
MLDITKQSFIISAVSIVFNPVFWNLIAMNEHRNNTLTKMFGARNGCYLLALTIFILGILRDYLFHLAIKDQQTKPIYWLQILGGMLFGIGNLLVVSSMYRLGVTGTYLGDYFGILMKNRVVGFPFNVTTSPMYNGSTMVFMGTALWYGSITGLVLSSFVYICYQVALTFEDPFTAEIYSKSANKKDTTARVTRSKSSKKRD